eukprot:1160608-Pelagomonas_calceolata.AAC.12
MIQNPVPKLTSVAIPSRAESHPITSKLCSAKRPQTAPPQWDALTNMATLLNNNTIPACNTQQAAASTPGRGSSAGKQRQVPAASAPSGSSSATMKSLNL